MFHDHKGEKILKILHVWDIGGDSYLAANFQRKLGHEVDVLKRYGFDPFGIADFYGYKQMKAKALLYRLNILKKARNYDLIHVHCIYEYIPLLRKLYPKKKIILHYHGTDLRNANTKKREKSEKLSDAVLLSTHDLKEDAPDAIYVPNPIDVEHFKYNPPNTKKAFTILGHYHIPLAKKYLLKNKLYLDFDILNRESCPIPYAEMPSVLCKYGTYIDLKFQTRNNELIRTISNLGRQALATGLTVLDYNLKYVKGLPAEHKPANAAKKLLDIYESL